MAVEKVLLVESQSTNPYENLALEEFLFETLPKNTCIFYLWQNDNTVVIGYNQNPFAQCNMKEVHAGSTYVARRLSGGGTVWHDMGNLNFTFISEKKLLCLEKNTSVLLGALNQLGFRALKDGRNDISVFGKKISGNAYYERDNKCLHHGTLLVNSDLEKMSEILRIDGNKWKERGIDSVRSRVGNLSDWIEEITVEKVKAELIKRIKEEYKSVTVLNSLEVDRETVLKLKEKYISDKWIWGRGIPGNFYTEKRFEWGNMCLDAYVEGNIIKSIEIYSDALEVEIFAMLKSALEGICITDKSLLYAVIEKADDRCKQIASDVILSIKESI